jgi:hypothetical protein
MRDLYQGLSKVNVFPVISILLGAYFFYSFSIAVGVPPVPALDWPSTMYLVLAVVFFFAPEVQRFELEKLHDRESKLEEAKGELLLLKSQLRTVVAAYNALLASTGNSAGSAARVKHASGSTVELPSAQAAEIAKQELDSALGEEKEQTQLDTEIEHFLNEEDFDIETALWDMRKVIDKELRRVAGREPANGNARPSTSRALSDEFARRHSDYAGVRSAFEYVLQVCDAAVNGVEIPADRALDAFQMGFRILEVLRKIAPAEAPKAAVNVVKENGERPQPPKVGQQLSNIPAEPSKVA